MSTNHQILVVDDDTEDHFILLDYLKDFGHEQYVSFIENGKKALEYLHQLTDDSLPKVIVLDLNMPIMNGTQTLIELKRNARFKNIPIIIFSTSENENERRKCLSYGAIDYMVKPSTYDQGLKIIERLNAFIEK